MFWDGTQNIDGDPLTCDSKIECRSFYPEDLPANLIVGPQLVSQEIEGVAAVQDRVVASGVAMTSSTRLKGTFSLRLCILNHTSTWGDVEATLDAMEEAARG